MLKKIIVILCMLTIVGFSITLLKKEQTVAPTAAEEQEVAVEEEAVLPETVFEFKKDELSEECLADDPQLCTIEKAVKCTLNPDFADCAKTDLPKFIFMKETAGLERPTEMNYKFIEKKVLPNNTVEFYTESNCNGGWFGLCQGNIIYVLSQKPENVWYVKNIYAIE
ncbi:MAG: hypothetical protein IJ852_02455 [Alphaproteobacteria bacterium]|nr:hypothetical protein [Alphaproteobacteria bacterium]